jgi:hypothetical protein
VLPIKHQILCASRKKELRPKKFRFSSPDASIIGSGSQEYASVQKKHGIRAQDRGRLNKREAAEQSYRSDYSAAAAVGDSD